ncbi:mannosyltransferase domain protein [Mycobacterium xenopi 4042]|uniref:Mannosyltransferase domain protein n=1 Tax=Mycobacterium xenopi 4042 TaxID=1299334 RepID=X8DYZ1_MYCXE|nr:mannosyltransferase domain protein [Mycobacterium xenopi 4042]
MAAELRAADDLAGRPAVVSGLGGLVYIVATLATLAWIALSGRRTVSSGSR